MIQPPAVAGAGTVPSPPDEVVLQVVQPQQPEGGPEDIQPPTPPPKDYPPKKVIIFGETGTGKSSLINMIADEPVAGVSNSAQGYTFQNHLYPITFRRASYIICDTAGLNEGERGTVPAQQALMNLKDLILGIHDGVHLLVYCIRACRYRDILRVNYDLFHGIICQSQVPIVAVITGLEHESPMDRWWTDNRGEFEQYGLWFRGCACVTATKGKKLKDGEHMFQEEYDLSQKTVRKLIEKSCSPTPWVLNHTQEFPQLDNQITVYYERFNSRDGSEREALNPDNFIAQELQEGGHNLVVYMLYKVLQYFRAQGNSITGDRPIPKRSSSASSGKPQTAMSSSGGAGFTGFSMPGQYHANSTPMSMMPYISGPRAIAPYPPQNQDSKDAVLARNFNKLKKPRTDREQEPR